MFNILNFLEGKGINEILKISIEVKMTSAERIRKGFPENTVLSLDLKGQIRRRAMNTGLGGRLYILFPKIL